MKVAPIGAAKSVATRESDSSISLIIWRAMQARSLPRHEA